MRTCRTFSLLENLYEWMTEETRPGFLANYKIVRPGPARIRPSPVDSSSIYYRLYFWCPPPNPLGHATPLVTTYFRINFNYSICQTIINRCLTNSHKIVQIIHKRNYYLYDFCIYPEICTILSSSCPYFGPLEPMQQEQMSPATTASFSATKSAPPRGTPRATHSSRSLTLFWRGWLASCCCSTRCSSWSLSGTCRVRPATRCRCGAPGARGCGSRCVAAACAQHGDRLPTARRLPQLLVLHFREHLPATVHQTAWAHRQGPRARTARARLVRRRGQPESSARTRRAPRELPRAAHPRATRLRDAFRTRSCALIFNFDWPASLHLFNEDCVTIH